MQLFVVSQNPVECAQALDDLRLNKMVLETAQLLCNAARQFASSNIKDMLYRPSHERHPCSLWLQQDPRNLSWGIELFKALHDEWEWRRQTNSGHLSWIKLAGVFSLYYSPLPWPTEFVNCSQFKDHELDVFTSYQLTLNHKWRADTKPPKWTRRGAPLWRL